MERPKLKIARYRHSATAQYVVEGLKEEGKRVRKFFSTKADAETWMAQKEIQINNDGVKAALEMPQTLRVMAMECAKKLEPFGKSIGDATRHFIEYLKQVERTCLVSELKDEFIAAKKKDGKASRYLADLRHRLKHFSEAFADRKVATLTTREVDDWLRELDLGPQSRNNYRRVLNVLFTYAVDRGYAATNPVARTAKAKVVDQPPEIFTVAQTTALLETASPEMLPYLAIGAFAGLRPAEMVRLDWKEVDLRRGYIEVTAANSKTATRRLVKILPNLAKWLAPYARKSGMVAPLTLQKRLTRIRECAEEKLKEAGGRESLNCWPSNALRHSYTSYHLAYFNDAAALALQLGHADTGMIFAHYRELVRQDEAEGYWKIEPASQDIQNIVSISA